MARFNRFSQNRAILTLNCATVTPEGLLSSIQNALQGLTLAEVSAQHADVPRRTAQRWLRKLVEQGLVAAVGEGRARRYVAIGTPLGKPQNQLHSKPASAPAGDTFPTFIPLSADSIDIVAYVNQSLQARAPVGYQREFLDAYQPNTTFYLPAPMRQQLHRLGQTAQASAPAGTYSRDILSRLLIDLSWASSHLEGNTYSRLDTRRLIEQGQAAQGKAALETQMILNHKTAIELLVENAGAVGLDRYTLMNLHSALAENLLPNAADEGRIRQHAVDIGQSVYRPLSAPQQIDEMLSRLLDKAQQIIDPFEQSFFMMVQLPYLQPFADINKRTSRLAANLPLFKANLCPLTFVDVPTEAYSRAVLSVYEMNRVELLRDLYLWAYERSTQEYLAIQQNLAEPDPIRLAWRDLIKQTVRAVVTQPGEDAMSVIRQAVQAQVPVEAQQDVQAVVVDELRRLHEGVLARYGLRLSEFVGWRSAQL